MRYLVLVFLLMGFGCTTQPDDCVGWARDNGYPSCGVLTMRINGRLECQFSASRCTGLTAADGGVAQMPDASAVEVINDCQYTPANWRATRYFPSRIDLVLDQVPTTVFVDGPSTAAYKVTGVRVGGDGAWQVATDWSDLTPGGRLHAWNATYDVVGTMSANNELSLTGTQRATGAVILRVVNLVCH